MTSEEDDCKILKNKIKTNKKMKEYLLVALCLVVFVAVLGSATETGLQNESYLMRGEEMVSASMERSHQGLRRMKSMPKERASEESGSSLGSEVMSAFGQAIEETARASKLPTDRMLVHNGDVSLSAPHKQAEVLANQIEGMVTSGGGYLERKSSQGDEDMPHIYFSARIPSTEFHAFLSKLKDIAKVTHLAANSEDVTDSYVDATTRAQTLQASINSLQTLMAEADTVEAVLQVQKELNRLTQDYESQMARANSLRKQSILSTLRIHIREDRHASVAKQGLGSGLVATFQTACGDVWELFGRLMNTTVYLSVLATALAIPAWLGYLAFRSIRFPLILRQDFHF